MNEVQVFSNTLFGSVRSITGPDGEPWFVGSDVAKCLGYTRPNDAINDHVEEDEKLLINISTYNTTSIRRGNPNARDALIRHVDEDEKGVEFCDSLGVRNV